MTIPDLSRRTESSARPVHAATRDDTIGAGECNTLAKITEALVVKAKRLDEEMEGCEKEHLSPCPVEKHGWT
ncbi:XRE family transcriptional regulator [uncultured Bilophila sp.]|uniref:XRE family transcriptional regulator n=1 Tax=uncultured Bilophila sp. TaxID=529385 RepID=UPI00260428E8|nr:XRE family transcriptional regulator [uncultured Bilophila sp.]